MLRKSKKNIPATASRRTVTSPRWSRQGWGRGWDVDLIWVRNTLELLR